MYSIEHGRLAKKRWQYRHSSRYIINENSHGGIENEGTIFRVEELDYSKRHGTEKKKEGKIIVDATRKRSETKFVGVLCSPEAARWPDWNKELGMTLFTRLDCFKKRRRSSIAGVTAVGGRRKKNPENRGAEEGLESRTKRVELQRGEG